MKKLRAIASLILAVMLLMTCAYAGCETPINFWLTGDVNHDNRLTNTDLVMMAKYVVGTYIFDDDQMLLGDINNDGAVDNYDLVTLSLFIVGRLLPTRYAASYYAINVNNYSQLVGDADYVFVGTVTEKTGVTYHRSGVEGEYNPGVPETGYEVHVNETIKGSLDSDISIRKSGGLAFTRDYYILDNGDYLPEKGDTRIFFAYAQTDGSLVVAGKNSNLPYNDKELERVKKAAANPAVFDRVRFKSYFDPTWEMDRTAEPWSRAIDAQVVDYSGDSMRVRVMKDGEFSGKIYTVDTSDCNFLIAQEALGDNYPVIIIPSRTFDPACDTFTADMVMGYRN